MSRSNERCPESESRSRGDVPYAMALPNRIWFAQRPSGSRQRADEGAASQNRERRQSLGAPLRRNGYHRDRRQRQDSLRRVRYRRGERQGRGEGKPDWPPPSPADLDQHYPDQGQHDGNVVQKFAP